MGGMERASEKEQETKLDAGSEALEKLNKIGWVGDWKFEENLKYETVDRFASSLVRCSRIGCTKIIPLGELKKCSNCKGTYCGRECQVADWKRRHKEECPLVAKALAKTLSVSEKRNIIEDQMQRIRMYMCPYVVVKTESLGRGLVFVSSTSSLSLWVHRDTTTHEGKVLDRSFKLEFFTMDDWDAFIVDNFELATCRSEINSMVSSYDCEKQFVLVVLLGCGHFACATFPLVPDVGICKTLGDMYEFAQMDSPLQLNVDTSDD